MRQLLIAGTLSLTLSITLLADERFAPRTVPGQQVDQQQTADTVPLETKRQFVRAQMVREFADTLNQTTLSEIDGKVKSMTPQRIDQLFKLYQKRAAREQAAVNQEQQLQNVQDPVYRQALIDQYKARLAAARSGGRPGFAPVITTLPSGTSLGASAVVSPDRRYVRMNLQPFFSTVNPGNTFTFQHSPYGFPQTHQQIPLRPVVDPRQPRVLRPRVGGH